MPDEIFKEETYYTFILLDDYRFGGTVKKREDDLLLVWGASVGSQSGSHNDIIPISSIIVAEERERSRG
jgi:hypothetical protein